jgi:phosphoribosylformylglycinamidine cyclo-ligase
MAHITGGGFYDNIPRVIPEGLRVKIRDGSWPIPDIFRMIQEKGGVDGRELFRTLNMGVGMAVVVAAKDATRALALFKAAKTPAYLIGELVPGPREVTIE